MSSYLLLKEWHYQEQRDSGDLKPLLVLTQAACTKKSSTREYLYPCSAFLLPSPFVRFSLPLLIFCQAYFKMENLSFLIKLIRLKCKRSQRSASIKILHSCHKLLLSVHLVLSVYMAPLSHVSLTELLISVPSLQAV